MTWDQPTVTLVAAVIAALASSTGALVALARSKRDSFAAIAAYRVAWMEKFREELINFSTPIKTMEGPLTKDVEKALVTHSDQIRFRMNPTERAHIAIIGQINGIVDEMRAGHPPDLHKLDEFTEAAQHTVKNEWERVKRELRGKSK